MIRLVGRFVFVNAFFQMNDEIDYESIGIKRPSESIPCRFDIESVVSWNEDEPGTTYIRTITGQCFHIDVPIDMFDEFMVANGSV